MAAKHLLKNSISHKLVFLALVSVIVIIEIFAICPTSRADADNTINGEIFIKNLVYAEDELLMVESNWENSEMPKPVIPGFWKEKDEIIKYHSDGYTISKAVYGVDNAQNLVIILTRSEDNYSKLFKYYHKKYDDLEFDNGDPIWWINQEPILKIEELNEINLNESTIIAFSETAPLLGCNVSGVVTDAEDPWKPVPGAFVQYYHRTLWGDIPVPEMNTFTDWFGHYTLEGIEDDNLPGVIKVFRYGYEVGESWSIWGAPEGEDTVYRFIQMTPEQPQPPVPPTPPDPPVPPGPVPPQPDPPQPVPPTPVPPTPVDPGTNVPQTGDSTSIALAIAGMLALCGASGFAAYAKRRKFDK